MKITGTATKLAVFAVVMLMILAGLLTVFGNMRFGSFTTYHARFTSASELRPSELVRIAGVEVGKVTDVALQEDNSVTVTFDVRENVPVPRSAKVAVRWANLIGDHYLEISRGSGDDAQLPASGTIAIERTSPAIDLDALIGGFRPLFRALDPAQVNRLTSSLVAAFQGEGGTIANVLEQLASLTSTLVERDALIGSVITNLNKLLGTIDSHERQFDSGLNHLQRLVSGLAKHADPIAGALTSVESASRSVSGLLGDVRPDIRADVEQLGRVARQVNSDSEFVDDTLAGLPEVYGKLTRLGIFGDFFSFYLCDANLKVNGKDGNPVYINVVGQRAGRCLPR